MIPTTRIAPLRSVLALVTLAAIAVACNEASPAPVAPVAPVASSAPAPAASPATPAADAAPAADPPSAAADASVDAAASVSGDASSPDFYACGVDSDCVAVPKVGCCHNGHKEAVNKDKAKAYEQSFTCPTPNVICPMYIVNDTRMPECNNGTHRCEMVAIDQIKCGGFIKNQHGCPSGYHCALPKIPDLPGTCVK